ncbi:MAG: porin family protein [Gammaproteobacteria bacterium]|nr:porin family protein [Gammaproteobacteria bacterium]
MTLYALKQRLMNRIVIKNSIAASLLLSAFNLQAGGFFVDASYLQANIAIAEQQFKPQLSQLGLGWQFTNRFSVEWSQAASAADDAVSTVSADIMSLSSVMLRYGSVVNSNVNTYVMLGYSELNLTMTGTSLQTDEVYTDLSLGLGFEETIFNKSGLRLHFDYLIHYDQAELTVSSVQLGLRYVFE